MGKEASLSEFGEIDYQELVDLAEEQTLVGLDAASLELVVDIKGPQVDLFHFIRSTLQIDEQNKRFNAFIGP